MGRGLSEGWAGMNRHEIRTCRRSGSPAWPAARQQLSLSSAWPQSGKKSLMDTEIPTGYRLITLHDREPPGEVLRHASPLPSRDGRYAKVLRYRYDAGKAVYEVLQFKAGRPPQREEVLTDLRADLAELEERLQELDQAGRAGAWMNRALFGGDSARALE